MKSSLTQNLSFKPALNIAHETFEGELVVVNLETGRYYAMRGASSDIFKLCLQEASTAEIVAAISANYIIDARHDIESSVENYLDKLMDEGIIVETSARSESGLSPFLEPAEKLPFSTPTLEIHNDMQDLLMLDPIHEVDEAGWPSLKPE